MYPINNCVCEIVLLQCIYDESRNSNYMCSVVIVAQHKILVSLFIRSIVFK